MTNHFSRIITSLRKENDLSQKQAAQHLGISQALLSHYEKGIRECGLDFVIKAADFYNVSCDYLLGRSDSRNQNSSDAVSAGQLEGNPELLKSKKQIINSLQMIYDLVGKIPQSKVYTELHSILSLYIYHILRLLGTVCKEENDALFTISSARALLVTQAAMQISYNKLLERLDFTKLDETTQKVLTDAFTFRFEKLQDEYPLYAKSLIALVDDVQHKICKS